MRHQWYALHTFTGHEKKVKSMIERLALAAGLEGDFTDIFVPEEEEVSSAGGKKRIIKRKLFPGYIFVCMEINEDTRNVIRRAAGQNTFASGDPTPLSGEEVRNLLKIREQPEDVQTSAYSEGEVVRIVSGPFAEFAGRIVEVNLNRETVKVMINIFGRDTPVELKFTEVEREE
ncbi:MAG: transcription termination/antitermination factor NusG [Armatimonadetes bacterium]|nr:transcription termination/antitermination factor NusG [Armatimonadota bacterium]